MVVKRLGENCVNFTIGLGNLSVKVLPTVTLAI